MEIVFDPTKASIYDNAPPGALMPWKRGTDPHPGWEWAEDLARFDAGRWSEDGAWYGWIRRKTEAREIAETISNYFASQRTVVAHVRCSNAAFACEGTVRLPARAGEIDEEALRAGRERVRIPDDATLMDIRWAGGVADVRYGWGELLPW